MLTKTESKLMQQAQKTGTVCVVYAQASRGNNSFGLRDRAAALNLVKKGFLRQLPTQPGRGAMSFELIKTGK